MSSELAGDITVANARRISERIRLVAMTARESLEKLQRLVDEAKAGEVHLVLGYASWTAYLSDVLGDEPLRLARDQRQELVSYLAKEGMSTRAIAPVVGVSREQVRKDIQGSGDNKLSPEPDSAWEDEVEDPDDDRWTSASAALAKVTETTKTEDQVDTDTGEVSAPRVTGLDNKSYPKPELAKPRRRPLPDQARTAGWDLHKAVERVQRLGQDDRFNVNKEQMAPHLRSHLTQAIEVCQDLLERLNNNN